MVRVEVVPPQGADQDQSAFGISQLNGLAAEWGRRSQEGTYTAVGLLS